MDEFCEHEDGEGEVVEAGRLVAGLGRDDFTLLDNGQPQEIVGFRSVSNPHDRPDSPIAVLLLIDTLDLLICHGGSRPSSRVEEFKCFPRCCGYAGPTVGVAGRLGIAAWLIQFSIAVVLPQALLLHGEATSDDQCLPARATSTTSSEIISGYAERKNLR